MKDIKQYFLSLLLNYKSLKCCCQTDRKRRMEKLETYKTPQQVDEAIQRLIETYFEDEFKDWELNGCPEDHIVHAWNILKTLYEQGGPDKVF